MRTRVRARLRSVAHCPITVIVEDSPCLYERDGSEGYVTNTDIDAALINNTQLHHVSLDCLWRIEVAKDWNVSFFSVAAREIESIGTQISINDARASVAKFCVALIFLIADPANV